MLSWILWIAMGILVGWIASLAMAAHSQQRMLLNVLWGVVGAAVAGLFGATTTADPDGVSVAGAAASFLGALVMVMSVEFVREIAV